ncbi:hypothetical protein [Acidocella sp.]|jgi:hypothetical protein|uniref:hypothetical protein n=1 Tax=Acidocella sp. TaxID=50710 RepID=UPI002F4005F3
MGNAKLGGIFAIVAMSAICGTHGLAWAGNPNLGEAGTPGVWAVLSGRQLSLGDLAKIRGEGNVTITDSMNTTNNQLNVTSSSSGTLSGSVSGLSVTGSVASNTIEANSGFTNILSNTGNNVMMNSSTAIFINAQ